MNASRASAWSLTVLIAAACAAPGGGPPFGQDPGKLGKATKAVTGASEPSSGGNPTTPTKAPRGGSTWSPSRDDEDDDDSLMGALLEPVGEIAFYLLASPVVGPHHWLEREPGTLRNGYYAAYPYDTAEGHVLDGSQARAGRQAWALRAVGEYGNDFAGIERYGASLRLDTAVRFGLDTAWSHFREDLPGGGSDILDLGDVNLVYRFAQGEKGEMRAGLGMNWFHDGPVDEYGFNATYAGDFYPARPWVLSFELDYGRVGDAERFHGRLTAGAQWGRGELFAGFDFESLDAVGLPTWTLGLRWWF